MTISRRDGFLARIDTFKKISDEFLERGTDHGGLLTLIAYFVMALLFVMEFAAFFSTETITTVKLDKSKEEFLTINYDITMHEIPCQYLKVDVWDAFGNERLNITQNTNKFRLNKEGVEHGMLHKDYHNIKHDEWEEYDAGHDDGKFTLLLTASKFSKLKNHDYTFINFFAPWCHWSRRLAPTWNDAAQKLEEIPKDDIGSDVVMERLNCQEFRQLCREQRIMAFPMMVLYKGTEKIAIYDGDRTEGKILEWLMRKVHAHHVDSSAKALGSEFADHGCRVVGKLTVARVPGNFHIEAASEIHNIDSTLTNVSHLINSLYFGPKLEDSMISRLPAEEADLIAPLDGKYYYVELFHKAPHHFLKVVTTEYLYGRSDKVKSYQFTTSNHIAEYEENTIPEAKFTYDISPVSVQISQRGKPWYDFLTNLLAITGGTYSFIQFIDLMFSKASKTFKKRVGKLG